MLTDVPVERVSLYEQGLYARLDAQHADILETIRTTGKFEKETEEKLCAALKQYTKDFLAAVSKGGDLGWLALR